MTMRSLVELFVLLLLVVGTTTTTTTQHDFGGLAAEAATTTTTDQQQHHQGTTITTQTQTATTSNVVSISYTDLESYFNNKKVNDDESDSDFSDCSSSSTEVSGGYCQQKQKEEHDEEHSGNNENCDDDDNAAAINDDQLQLLALKLHQAIEDGFGGSGGGDRTRRSLGFLEVTNIPKEKVVLRTKVLKLAHQLANLPQNELIKLEKPKQQYTIGWSRGKEEFKPGIPDIGKGSFYYNPFSSLSSSTKSNNNNNSTTTTTTTNNNNNTEENDDDDSSNDNNSNNVFPDRDVLPDFENSLKEMTHFMAQVGLWIVQLIDEHLDLNIYESLESCEMAKARLLYYYPPATTTTAATAATTAKKAKKATLEENQDNDENDIEMKKQQQQKNDDDDDDDSNNNNQWWCGWHKDHGSITALLPGELIPVDKDDDREDKNNELLVVDPYAGLYIDSSSHHHHRDGKQQQQQQQHHIVLPSTSLGFQLGETIELMTHGRLRATPHAVKAPSSSSCANSNNNCNNNNVGRASLALFLQPPADQSLPPIIDGKKEGDDVEEDENVQPVLIDDSLRSRWRPTFGEFQQATINAFN